MTRLEIHRICAKYGIIDYTINDDMSISVEGDVDLTHKNLKSLPITFKEVSGDFYCSENQLTSLKYCPETVGGNFYCSRNQLTSLEGCPGTVGGYFFCSNNQLTNFDGLPEFFEQDIHIGGNPVDEIYRLFNQDPRCIYWIREFGAIQGDEVVRDRLEEVYHTLGMDIPKDIELGSYSLI